VRITVLEFGVNDGDGSGARCSEIKVRTDTMKLSNMVIASFGDGRKLVGQRTMFSEVASTVGDVKCRVVYLVKLLFDSNG